jgi:hypothetical protein
MSSSDDPIATDPDAALLAAIDELRKAWGEVRRLDDEDPGLDVAAIRAIRLERKNCADACYVRGRLSPKDRDNSRGRLR